MKKVKCLVGLHDWEDFTLHEKLTDGRDTRCNARRCKECDKAERVQ